MGLDYQYYLYFPRWAVERVLRDLASRSAPQKEDRLLVTVILPGGAKVVFPSWASPGFESLPLYDIRAEPIRHLNMALLVKVDRAERRLFRRGNTLDSQNNAIVFMTLAVDVKLDQARSFVQFELGAYTTTASRHFSSESFHRLVADILRANDGLCAILDYERGYEASLRWLKGRKMAQPIPIQLESPRGELRALRKNSHLSPSEETLWSMRRFDQAAEEWIASTLKPLKFL